ncbi:ABC transporter permease [Clostridium carboxidivorans P7]|uniref:Ornithine carbamoyltransferase n=1 Tax=Clostridium carboxidivorans P7 TaxID=536227 RepID=C6Q0Y9_9CLOT|nr:ABC transporter permease [Clostridium carboxidivorans]AKN32243.1 ABC transporter permease [Clostridium carboxidivorans P7]EET84834.1 Ornithine carbamoyltransferase [Clostridium carboxidivorans P7]
MNKKVFNWISVLYTTLIFLFLYVPIFVVIVYSFNASKSNAIWAGFTLDWYGKLFDDTNVMIAFKNSLIIAVSSTIISSVIGTLGAIGLYKYKFRGKSIVDMLLNIVIVIPEIIMGISLLIYFAQLNVPFGITTLVLSHATFCIPFVLIVVRARFAGFDSSIEDAAMDLGANRFKVFTSIILPLILPGILSGAMLAFALSFDDVIINFFVSGSESTTLPIKIFSMLKFGLSPEINALCTIMLIFIFILIIVSQGIRFKRQDKNLN